MVSELEKKRKESSDDIFEEIIAKLQAGIDLKCHESRKRFVDYLCSESHARKALAKSVDMMVKNYYRLLKQYSKGKRFAQFEQEWLIHIEDYFTDCTDTHAVQEPDTDSCYTAWKCVVDKYDCAFSIDEQRIVVSTIAYIVYDIMTGKIKDYKSSLSCTSTDDISPTPQGVAVPLVESNVSLYRYGGFALHSLIQKYQDTAVDGSAASADLMPILKQLKIKHDEVGLMPYGIQQLNQGGLVIMSPSMLLYLRKAIEKVSSLVNEEKCHEYGHSMIAVARAKIENDSELHSTFTRCINNIGIDSSLTVVSKVYNELTRKIFHARVNEYMTASVEIELERSGKAVKAEQSLRDQLKTYSGIKTR